jgi:hypothetical protein
VKKKKKIIFRFSCSLKSSGQAQFLSTPTGFLALCYYSVTAVAIALRILMRKTALGDAQHVVWVLQPLAL